MDKTTKKIKILFKERLNIDISIYDSVFINKIIKKRATEKDIVFFEDYIKILDSNTDELYELNNLFHINYSFFFRNNLTFAFLNSIILPELLKSKSLDNQPLRIWSAGCAAGEEPYSIAILLIELQKKFDLNVPINFIATDIDDKSLEIARKGNYNKSLLLNVKLKYLEKYFNVESNAYSIIDTVKKMIVFEKYDITSNRSFAPPGSIFGNFDLISCRNVLIYMSQEYQNVIFDKIHKALEKDGILLLGKSEFIPNLYKNYFEKINSYCPLYRKTS